MKEWVEKNLIIVWASCSVVFAFITHCLFSIVAPCEWLEAKWSAGDILTFVSTVALGLLAVWQNKQLNEENDKSQKRMQSIASKANELAIVNKIIEYEGNRISAIKAKKQTFIDACNTEGVFDDLSDIASQPDDFKKIFVKMKMDSRNKQIRLCGFELISELKAYSYEAGVTKLVALTSDYSKSSLELIEEFREGSPVDATYAKKTDLETEFITCISDFISARENKLNKILYGDLTLEQIKVTLHDSSCDSNAGIITEPNDK